MSCVTHRNVKEGGNVVALTLLGLAVAILTGVVVLYLIGKSSPQPMYTPKPASEDVVETQTAPNPREGWRVYEDEMYGFHVEFPQGWVVATGTLPTGEPVITIAQALSTSSLNTVFSLEDVASHVSVYPQGITGGDILNKTKASEVVITVPQASASDYILKNGKPWATKATFEKYPESWSEAGFVFARAIVEEEVIEYMRGEKQIAEFEFDPLQGDALERTGFLDSKIRETQEEILRSFSFGIGGEAGDVMTTISPDFILLETPLRDTTVASPLTVRGEVLGEWYTDESISVRLETSDGEALTEVPVTLGEWFSQEKKPFEVSLVFDTPTATSGNLIVGNLQAENKKVSIPVTFSQ
jgi:hypothetical protein